MYSGVTLGLVHGSTPHAFVLCHKAGATEIEGCPGHPIPPLDELVELHERIALPARKARVACIAVNTAEARRRRRRPSSDRRRRRRRPGCLRTTLSDSARTRLLDALLGRL